MFNRSLLGLLFIVNPVHLDLVDGLWYLSLLSSNLHNDLYGGIIGTLVTGASILCQPVTVDLE